MQQGLVRLTLALAMLALVSPLAFAQGGATSSIVGVVLDSGGGAVPGATVEAKNNATNVTTTTVSGSNGSFTIPAISIGTYTVTVTLQGFKTAVISNVVVTAAGPADVRATLEVGGAIITESALSFLGLGFPSDVPTWGQMLFQAKDYLELYPHEALFPGTMIFLTVLAINYIGDGLRDALDPRKTT